MHYPTDMRLHTMASCETLTGTRNVSVGPPCRIDPTTHHIRLMRCILVSATKFGVVQPNVLFNDALNTFLFTIMWRRT